MSAAGANPNRWAELHRRLGQLTAGAQECSPAETTSVLESRARALARRPPREDDDGEMEEFVLVRVEQDRIAVPLGDIAAVIRVQEFALLPGSEPSLVGVTVHRGELLPLLSLHTQRPDVVADASLEVVVLRRGSARAGLIVDELMGLKKLSRRSIHDAGAAARVSASGVTTDGVYVLETRSLVRTS